SAYLKRGLRLLSQLWCSGSFGSMRVRGVADFRSLGRLRKSLPDRAGALLVSAAPNAYTTQSHRHTPGRTFPDLLCGGLVMEIRTWRTGGTLAGLCLLSVTLPAAEKAPLQFQVTFDPAVSAEPFTGRVVILLSRQAVQTLPGGLNWFRPEPVF